MQISKWKKLIYGALVMDRRRRERENIGRWATLVSRTLKISSTLASVSQKKTTQNADAIKRWYNITNKLRMKHLGDRIRQQHVLKRWKRLMI